MKRILLTFALMIAGTTQAIAGYTQVAGTSYFTDGHDYFVRQKYTVCVGWRRCETRHRYVRTNWRPVIAKAKYEENWRDTITKAAVDLKRSNQEHLEYMEAIKALGLEGAGSQYGANPTQYGGNGLYSQQGNTNYQLRYSTISEIYGQTNTAVLFNQAENLALAAASAAEKAGSQFNAALQMEIQGKNRAAEIQAQSLGVAEAIRATAEALKAGTPSAVTTTNVYGPNDKPEAEEPNLATGTHLATLKLRCGACHGGNSPKAGLWLDGSTGLSLEKFQKAMTMVLSKKMPPEGENPLEPEELGDVLQSLTALSDKEYKPE